MLITDSNSKVEVKALDLLQELGITEQMNITASSREDHLILVTDDEEYYVDLDNFEIDVFEAYIQLIEYMNSKCNVCDSTDLYTTYVRKRFDKKRNWVDTGYLLCDDCKAIDRPEKLFINSIGRVDKTNKEIFVYFKKGITKEMINEYEDHLDDELVELLFEYFPEMKYDDEWESFDTPLDNLQFDKLHNCYTAILSPIQT